MKWYIVTLAACAIFGITNAQTTCPTKTCSPSPIQVSSSATTFSSSCYPNNYGYAKDVNCTFVLNPPGSSYTQITIVSFDLESWYDYLKFDGPTNFIIFANSSTNQVIITGYPNATINARMISDSNKELTGFSMSVSNVSDEALLTQFTGYRNMSAAQVMKSPLYVTSYDDNNQTNKMDVMLMNIPNTTHTPAASWVEYVGLVGRGNAVTVTEIIATGFKLSWTAIEGVTTYTVTVNDTTGKNHFTNETSTNTLTVTQLPSGTFFNINVRAKNKLGSTASMISNATTVTTSPTELKIVLITQTSVSMTWKPVNGATSYEVYVSESGKRTAAKDVGTFYFDGLTAGKSYTLNVTAIFSSGKNAASSSIPFTTAPGNVTGITTPNVTTTTVEITWTQVLGATTYQVSIDNVPNKNVSSPPSSFTNLGPGRKYNGNIVAFRNTVKSFATHFTFTTKLLDKSHKVQPATANASSISVSWTEVIGADEYHVRLINSSGAVVQNDTLKSGTLKKIFVGLPAGRKFTVNVRVRDSTGNLHPMNPISANTSTTTVTGMKTNSTNTSITFSWEGVRGAKGYKVYNGTLLVATQPSSTQYIMSGLSPGSHYKIRVAAIFDSGDSETKEIAGWTIPAKVTGLAVPPNEITSTKITATWVHSPNTNYTLSLRINGESKYTNQSANSGGTYPVDPGRKYILGVKAENPGGAGEEETAEFITKLDPPLGLKNNSNSKSRFQLTWQAVKGATKYSYKCGSEPEVNTTERETSVWLNNLQPDTTYSCIVTAYSASAKSEASTAVKVKTSKKSCTSTTCQNGGKCDEGIIDFNCVCTSSYKGRNCENVKDWCGEEGHNTSCVANSKCTNDPKLGRGTCQCNPGFTGDATIKCIGFCQNTDLNHNSQTFTFNLTYVGETAYSNENCGGRSKASIACSTNATGYPSFDQSKLVSVPCNLTLSKAIPNVSSVKDATTAEITKTTQEIQVLTSGSTKVKEKEVKAVADYIDGISKTATQEKNTTVTTNILANVANAVDNLIKTKSLDVAATLPPPVTAGPTQSPAAIQQAQRAEEKAIKKKILNSLNSLAQQVKMPANESQYEITTPSMVLKVIDTKNKMEPLSYSPVIARTDSSNGNTSTQTLQPVNIIIPVAALQLGSGDSNQTLRISFILHRDSSLFPVDSGESPKLIIAANVGTNTTIRNLKNNIKMRHNIEEKAGNETPVKNNRFEVRVNNFKCVYWNKSEGKWLRNGCCLNGRNSSDLTVCECDHLTNFALIVAKDTLKNNVPLEVTSLVGLGLSMAGLILTIIIHAIKEDIRTRRPTQILFNICFNLLVASALFVAGIDKTTVINQCRIIATFMHFFYLASWTWMTVYAYDMYRSLVLVFGAGKSHYMTKCALFGYGVPLLITLFDAGISFGYVDRNKAPEGICKIPTGYQHLDGIVPKKSAYLADGNCWIHEYSLYFAFLFPVALMLAFNTFVYGMVIKTLVQRGKAVQSSAKKTSIKDNIFISITLTSSTGVAWVTGYFMLLSTDEHYLTVMSWVFALLNTTQGVVIFLSTCVRNENMRKVWIEPITNFFSSTTTRIRMLSRKTERFDITTKSETGASSMLSTSEGTKDTTVKSVSVKELTSESIL